MDNSNYNFSDYKKDALTKPRDLCWDNWFKFEKVGDLVQGFILDVFFRESQGDFPEQRGITLKQPDNTLINVGIKRIDFVLAKTDTLRIGDALTVEFQKELPPQIKGHNPTKQMGFYGKNLEQTVRQANVGELAIAGNETVKQLEQIDRGLSAEEEAKASAEFEGIDQPKEDFTPGDSTPQPSKEAVALTTPPEEKPKA